MVKEGKLKEKDLEVAPISEDKIPFDIPECWGWCRLLGEISTYVNTQKKINAAIADPMQSSGQAGICPDVQKGVTEGCYY